MRRLATVLLAASAALAVASGAAAATAEVRIREAALDPSGDVRLTVAVSGLTPKRTLSGADFAVVESGRQISRIAVRPLLSSKTARVSVALAVDVSGSTAGKPLADAKVAAKRFISALPAGVRVAVVAFGETVRTLAPPTTDRGRLSRTIDSLAASGATALYDGVAHSARLLSKISGQHNILVFSDGRDTSSKTTLDAAVAAAVDAGAPVVSVALATPDLDRPTLETIGRKTGGRSLQVADSRALAGAFARAAEDIASQYVVRYSSARIEPRELDIRVTVIAGGAPAADTIVVLNPRTAPVPGLVPAAQQEGLVQRLLAVFEQRTGLWIGLGAATAALLLMLGVLLFGSGGGGGAKALQKVIRPYRRHRFDEEDATGPVRGTGPAGRLVSMVEGIPRAQRYYQRAQARLDDATMPLRASEFMIVRFMGAAGGGILAYALTRRLWLAILAPVIVWLAPAAVIQRRISRRRAQFMEQIPDALQMLGASLQAGHSLVQAIDIVCKEGSPPLSTELQRVLVEARLGVPLEDSLETMARHIGNEDFRWVVIAMNIQRQTGGNLAELLQTMSETLRDRERVRRQIKSLSAEGRLSANVLIALPFLVVTYLAIIRPAYLRELTHDGTGRIILGAAIALLTTGIMWLRSIVRIPV